MSEPEFELPSKALPILGSICPITFIMFCSVKFFGLLDCPIACYYAPAAALEDPPSDIACQP